MLSIPALIVAFIFAPEPVTPILSPDTEVVFVLVDATSLSEDATKFNPETFISPFTSLIIAFVTAVSSTLLSITAIFAPDTTVDCKDDATSEFPVA